MSKTLKASFVVLAAFMVLAAFAGCASRAPQASQSAQATPTAQASEKPADTKAPEVTAEPLKEVVLKIICVGDASPGDGSKMVADAVNAVIKPKINATIATEYLPWTDWSNKYQLVFASGEEFDGIYTANWSQYQSQATKNGFLEITDEMLVKYAPDLKADLPEMAWKQAKINGKIYMIPTTFSEFVTPHLAVREDLKVKYNVPEIKDLDTMGAYLEAIKKNETNMVPLDLSATESLIGLFDNENEYAVVGGVSLWNFVYKFTDSGATIVNLFDTPEFAQFVQRMNQWQKAGYWSKNVLSNKTPSSTSFDNGTSGSCVTNILAATNYSYAWPKQHPDWQVQVYDMAQGRKQIGTPFIGSGIGIHNTSKNPDRLLMFVNLARTDKDLNQLLCYGIKDTHWKLVGEDQVEYIRGDTKVDYTDGLSWFFRNAKFQLKPAGVYSNYDMIFDTAKKNEASHILQAFNFDDTALKNEMAAIANVLAQYAFPAVNGFTDPTEGIATLNQKMKEAGADKVLAELKTQADKFIADNAK